MAAISNPTNDRALSLMALPTELLSQILEEVLVHDGSIEDSDRLGRVEYRKSIASLNARVLRTCNQFFQIGNNKLYEENTLNIRCHAAKFPEEGSDPLLMDGEDWRCHILEGSFGVPAWITDLDEDNSRIDRITDAKWIHQNYPDLLRFRHIQLEISFANPQFVYNCCRLLAPLLEGKKVVLRLSADIYDQNGIEGTADEKDQACARALKACQLLRCDKFRLEEGHLPLEIHSTITGPSPVPAIFDRWLQLVTTLRKSMPWGLESFLERHVDEVDAVFEAMIDMSIISFAESTALLGRLAEPWVREAREILHRAGEELEEQVELLKDEAARESAEDEEATEDLLPNLKKRRRSGEAEDDEDENTTKARKQPKL